MWATPTYTGPPLAVDLFSVVSMLGSPKVFVGDLWLPMFEFNSNSKQVHKEQEIR